MKTRIGFISNSSSTSFYILAEHRDSITDKLFNIFRNRFHEFTTLLVESIHEEMHPMEDESLKHLPEEARKMMEKNPKLKAFSGIFSNFGEGGDRLSAFICNHIKISYNEKDFFIEKSIDF